MHEKISRTPKIVGGQLRWCSQNKEHLRLVVISNLATPVTNMQVRSAPFKVWPCLSEQDLSAALSDTERVPSSLKSFVSPSLCCGLMVMQEGAGHSCATDRDG